MAEREDLEFTYSLIDRVFRLSLGELADFSGAKYDGDFSLSLEEAQRRKHEYVAEQIGIGPGRRVLDLGCGWGPLLAFVRSRGDRGRRDAVIRAGGGMPAARARRPPARRTAGHPRDASARSTPSRASAPSSTSALPPSTAPDARRRSIAASSRGRGRAARGRALLPSDDGLRAQHDPGRAGRHRRPARLRRLVPRPDGPPVPGVLASARPGAGRRQRRAPVSSGVEHERAARLHRDDPPVAAAVRRAQRAERRCSSSGSCRAGSTSADFRLAFTSGVSANSVCFERELLDHYRLVFEKTR